MKIRRFNENSTIYSIDWHDILPKEIEIIRYNKNIIYKLGNIMKNSDMIQIIYSHGEWAIPSDLEFDFYFLNKDGHIKLDIDITLGDFMASEFSIEKPDKVSIIQYTSRGSKFDPSNSIFALSNSSIDNLVKSINHIEGFNISSKDLEFLNKDYKK